MSMNPTRTLACTLLFASGLLFSVACSSDPVDGTGAPQSCEKPSDCPSNICTPAGTCALASVVDGIQNGDETDVDCGGTTGKTCDDAKKCRAAPDCSSAVCKDLGQGLRCQAPSSTDATKNGSETDTDCGGPNAPKCQNGRTCVARGDCTSGVCTGGACQAPTVDGVKNGTETDVDCGGPASAPCADDKTCGVADDCTSKVCTGAKCIPPSPTDKVQNGTETDVDCGGAGNPKCATAKACKVAGDCASDGCAYNFKCALRRSCIQKNGGETCGTGEVGQTTAVHESCCATAPVPGMPAVQLGKYGVTAGRMRAFLAAIGGNVRGFIRGERAAGRLPANAPMNAAWDLYLPTSFDGSAAAGELAEGSQNDATPIPGVYTSVHRHLGGFIFRNNTQTLTGCFVNSPGTHTYWMTPQVQSSLGDIAHVQSQDINDTKGVQCIDYLMAQSFCIWDGGHLQLKAEHAAAWGAAMYPWGATPAPKGQGSGTFAGNRFPTATDASLRAANSPFAPAANQSIEFANFNYSYEYPNLVGSDYAVFVGAPGRLKGRSANGHSMNDGLMELTGTIVDGIGASPWNTHVSWSRNGSFEGHAVGAHFVSHLMNKYGKVGLRCAYAR